MRNTDAEHRCGTPMRNSDAERRCGTAARNGGAVRGARVECPRYGSKTRPPVTVSNRGSKGRRRPGEPRALPARQPLPCRREAPDAAGNQLRRYRFRRLPVWRSTPPRIIASVVESTSIVSEPSIAPSRAWKTYASREFRGGDTVLCRRGSVFRGVLHTRNGADQAPVTYGAYGEGDKPVFLGSVPLLCRQSRRGVCQHRVRALGRAPPWTRQRAP
jgi:hypothetical protein